MNNLRSIAILFLIIVLTFSCEEDDTVPLPLGDYEKGYFITNEGPFQNGSGTLTFVDENNNVTQNVYKTVNNEDLGSLVQSMNINDDNAYIVINGSHKIVVANRYTMKKVAIIEGDDIKNPRYFVAVGNTGYVSNWGDPGDANDDFIAVVDLNTNTVTKKIPVGEGPEDMLVDGNNIYVNLQGGWSQNNKVEIIDTLNNSVSTTLTVGDVPNAISKDSSGAIWVLCGGKPSYTGAETNGKLAKIVNNVVTLIDFGTAEHPENLTVDSDQMYYNLNGKVYNMATVANEIPVEEISEFDGFYYSMKIYNGKFYATNAADFVSEGSLKVYNITSGVLENTITTGLIPGSIVFQ